MCCAPLQLEYHGHFSLLHTDHRLKLRSLYSTPCSPLVKRQAFLVELFCRIYPGPPVTLKWASLDVEMLCLDPLDGVKRNEWNLCRRPHLDMPLAQGIPVAIIFFIFLLSSPSSPSLMPFASSAAFISFPLFSSFWTSICYMRSSS